MPIPQRTEDVLLLCDGGAYCSDTGSDVNNYVRVDYNRVRKLTKCYSEPSWRKGRQPQLQHCKSSN